MMLKPSVNELAKNGESTYGVVIAAAKHAREITDEAEASGVPLTEKSVTISIRDISEGKVRIVDDSE